jgi:hypothetical protein
MFESSGTHLLPIVGVSESCSAPVQVVSPEMFERLLGACVLPGALKLVQISPYFLSLFAA